MYSLHIDVSVVLIVLMLFSFFSFFFSGKDGVMWKSVRKYLRWFNCLGRQERLDRLDAFFFFLFP